MGKQNHLLRVYTKLPQKPRLYSVSLHLEFHVWVRTTDVAGVKLVYACACDFGSPSIPGQRAGYRERAGPKTCHGKVELFMIIVLKGPGLVDVRAQDHVGGFSGRDDSSGA